MSVIHNAIHGQQDAARKCVIVAAGGMTLFAAQLRRMMEAMGFSVAVAGGVEEAVAMCWQGMPDVLLMPQDMADGQALRLIRGARRMPRGKHGALFSYGERPDAERLCMLVREGVNDCMIQPLSPAMLEMKLRQAGVA